MDGWGPGEGSAIFFKLQRALTLLTKVQPSWCLVVGVKKASGGPPQYAAELPATALIFTVSEATNTSLRARGRGEGGGGGEGRRGQRLADAAAAGEEMGWSCAEQSRCPDQRCRCVTPAVKE
jgi:hypothetical protein